MSEDRGPRPLQLAAVEILTDYDSMIRITDINGARLHYLLTDSGALIFGRPFITGARDGYRAHLFWPSNPGEPPILLKVVKP